MDKDYLRNHLKNINLFNFFIKPIKFIINIAKLNYYLIRLEYNYAMDYLKKIIEDLK
jgi:hypothetical protein